MEEQFISVKKISEVSLAFTPENLSALIICWNWPLLKLVLVETQFYS